MGFSYTYSKLLVLKHMAKFVKLSERSLSMKKSQMAWRGNNRPDIINHTNIINKNAIRPLKQQFQDVSRIRNIAVIAHVDAGKTTLTERMLYYSGSIARLGDVNDGTCVTDYTHEERSRGISVSAATVSFVWHQHRVTLVDTPGHVDFGSEVECALAAVDGALLILDVTRGVQAQTLSVWGQTSRHGVPAVIALNKMDRVGRVTSATTHTLAAAIASIERHLLVRAVPIHVPLYSDTGTFSGVIDVIHLRRYTWSRDTPDTDGCRFHTAPVTQADCDYERALLARDCLIDALATHDTQFADEYLSATTGVDDHSIMRSVARAMCSRHVLPVMCVSAYTNVAVQPLLDTLVQLLPPPVTTADTLQSAPTSVFVFKTTHDKHLGRLHYVRVMSGSLHSSTQLTGTNSHAVERIGRIFVPYADSLHESTPGGDTGVTLGNIVVLSGLHSTVTGDTLTAETTGREDVTPPPQRRIVTPPPVCFCTVEAECERDTRCLHTTLERMCAEDPSLRVTCDPTTDTLTLAAMGQLQLEIVRSRLHREHGLRVTMGPTEVAYLQTLSLSAEQTAECHHTHTCTVQGHRYTVHISLHLTSTTHDVAAELGRSQCEGHIAPPTLGAHSARLNTLRTAEAQQLMSHVPEWQVRAAETGVQRVLSAGTWVGAGGGSGGGGQMTAPIVCVQPWISALSCVPAGRRMPSHLIAAAASKCTRQLLAQHAHRSVLLEPLMHVQVSVSGCGDVAPSSDEVLRRVAADIVARRGRVLQCAAGDGVLQCQVPLAELGDYAAYVRALTSGTAQWSMRLLTYAPVTGVV